MLYIHNPHFYSRMSIVFILYDKLLINTDASCTCVMIMCRLMWFAGPRGKYVPYLNSKTTTCLSLSVFSLLIVPFGQSSENKHWSFSSAIFLFLRQHTVKQQNPIFRNDVLVDVSIHSAVIVSTSAIITGHISIAKSCVVLLGPII